MPALQMCICMQSWMEYSSTTAHAYIYRILLNKCACLNKHSSRLLTVPVHISKLFSWSHSNFQHSMLRYLLVYTINFIEIRQGWRVVFCLRVRRIYSVKYGSICACICVAACVSGSNLHVGRTVHLSLWVWSQEWGHEPKTQLSVSIDGQPRGSMMSETVAHPIITDKYHILPIYCCFEIKCELQLRLTLLNVSVSRES